MKFFATSAIFAIAAAQTQWTMPATTEELIANILTIDNPTVAAALRYVQTGIDLMEGANSEIVAEMDGQLQAILGEIEKLGPNLDRIQMGHDDAAELIFDSYSELYPAGDYWWNLSSDETIEG